MSVSESIKKRRAIYPSQYKEEDISENDIKEILENAISNVFGYLKTNGVFLVSEKNGIARYPFANMYRPPAPQTN